MELTAAYVLGIGVINIQSGKTMYDWSIYESPETGFVFLTNHNCLLYATKETFEVGDTLKELRGNDSLRKLKDNVKIIDAAPCIKEKVIEMLYKNGYDYRVLKAFTKKSLTRKLQSSYSVKGVE
jgi:hypothetical protein